ncbi:phosphatases II [Phlebopus sp. FC_14]|nr:phosphatases II [Phlebopus sp. FC_14]
MSSTVVEVFPTTPSDVLDMAPQQRVPSPVGPPRRALTSPQVVYDPWVHQLAPLASQYHLSEYNRIKYGYRGCPAPYTPLSFHLPDAFRELRERQTRYANYATWWPCPRSTVSDLTPFVPPSATAESSTPDSRLQRDLFRAISDSISDPNRPHGSSHSTTCAFRVKTSESNPINISAIIPPESLHSISSHLTRCNKAYPVMFDIPLHYSLDQITGYTQTFFSSLAQMPLFPVHSTTVSTLLPPIPLRPPQSANESVSDALQAAISTTIAIPPIARPLSRTFPSQLTTKRGEEQDGSAMKISKLLTSRKSMFSLQGRSISEPVEGLPSVLDFVSPGVDCPPRLNVPPTGPSPPRSYAKPRLMTVCSRSPSSRKAIARQSFKLGNLLLSSCPGKKVRLNGPVRGRSAVCRDLKLDLRRVRALGARCVVCCLDDEELQFLGISWPEYYQTAHEERLDVLRIPLPEGFAPLSPQSLDANLVHIIETYTLHGVPVLVHCRGGVGRAGLVACCWMLKLGLCGWIETDVGLGSPVPDTGDTDAMSSGDYLGKNFQWNSNTVLRRDTLQLVERVIGVVRRRRSAKAIETLEQVQFLVEYVDYLRASGRTDQKNGVPNSAHTYD